MGINVYTRVELQQQHIFLFTSSAGIFLLLFHQQHKTTTAKKVVFAGKICYQHRVREERNKSRFVCCTGRDKHERSQFRFYRPSFCMIFVPKSTNMETIKENNQRTYPSGRICVMSVCVCVCLLGGKDANKPLGKALLG